MRRYYWIWSIFFVAVLFLQCRKTLSYIGVPDSGASIAPAPITSSVQGDVTDENGLPAAGVNITCGSHATTTDTNGYFRFSNIVLDKNTSLVTGVKTGYFAAYRVFAATSGCNQLKIQLLPKPLAGTVPASSGGTVTLSNGAKITLPANGVVIASSNTAYTGTINVYATYIDPTASNIAKIIPGSFVGNDVTGNRVLLSSYGMLAVELQSANGQLLQIKTGNTAALTFPVPSTLLSSAPASIALWYIDDSTGIWQEQGSATKQGNNYSGTVKHFTYWNCDFANPAIPLSFTLQTTSGVPVVNTYIEVVAADSAGLGHGYTDSLGQASGLVPANTPLILKVYTFDPCDQVAYSQAIPAITTATDLGIIKINIPSQYFLTFTGTIVDCSGLPVTNGTAMINFDGTTRYASTNSQGQFTTDYVLCSNPPTISVIGFNNTTQQQGSLQTISVTLPVTNETNLVACGTSSVQYINYILDGNNYVINSNESGSSFNGATASTTVLSGFASADVDVSLRVNATGVGIFNVDSIVSINSYYSFPFVQTQSLSITFTNFPVTIGDYYEGSFSGNFLDDKSISHTISSATFRIRRTQ
jgi:hypothetical protein